MIEVSPMASFSISQEQLNPFFLGVVGGVLGTYLVRGLDGLRGQFEVRKQKLSKRERDRVSGLASWARLGLNRRLWLVAKANYFHSSATTYLTMLLVLLVFVAVSSLASSIAPELRSIATYSSIGALAVSSWTALLQLRSWRGARLCEGALLVLADETQEPTDPVSSGE